MHLFSPSHCLFSARAVCLLWAGLLSAGAQVIPVKPAAPLHVGRPGQPEFDVFARADPPPAAPPVSFEFEARAAAGEQTLFIRQDDVKEAWPVEVNGRRVGRLHAMEASLIHGLALPPGTLRDGPNELRLLAPSQNDDILLGDIFLDPRPLAKAVGGARLEIEVVDKDLGEPLPCRLTLTDPRQSLIPLRAAPGQNLAVRPGVVYCGNGRAVLHLRPGRYDVVASRGFEYGVDRETLVVREGEDRVLRMELGREVDTRGWFSCDPHTHTFTFSRHGDATLEERVVTLAGEHIEMPVATDHNILTDYREAAERMGVADYFTPVIGDEVTTRQAHFNVFPIEAGSRVPDFRILDWKRLFGNIRETPGVEVIILNHPLNVHNGFQPFSKENYRAATGEMLRTMESGFDALELINSSAQQSDMMAVYRGWFGLLNAGHRVTGLGSSDGHDVSRYIVGQGRTYIRGEDQDPGGIDVREACRSLKAGHALVSMGLWVILKVDDQFGPGDLAGGLESEVSLRVKVAGPSWVQADRLELFANGQSIHRQELAPTAQPGTKAEIHLRWPRPDHDVHLVALATGPGIREPFWAIPRPYQPSSTQWTPRVAGSTNPIWLDADGDGAFTAARGYAQVLVNTHGTHPETLLPALAKYDAAVAAQAAALCQGAGRDLRGEPFQAALARCPPAVQAGFDRVAPHSDEP